MSCFTLFSSSISSTTTSSRGHYLQAFIGALLQGSSGRFGRSRITSLVHTHTHTLSLSMCFFVGTPARVLSHLLVCFLFSGFWFLSLSLVLAIVTGSKASINSTYWGYKPPQCCYLRIYNFITMFVGSSSTFGQNPSSLEHPIQPA